MPTDAMPVTALAVLMLLAGGIGLIGALFTTLLLLTIYRERRDIRRAKAIGKAKQEILDREKELKARILRRKEEEVRLSSEGDTFFKKYEDFFNGI